MYIRTSDLGNALAEWRATPIPKRDYIDERGRLVMRWNAVNRRKAILQAELRRLCKEFEVPPCTLTIAGTNPPNFARCKNCE